MTITPAQFEAAAKAMEYIDGEKYKTNWYRTLADIALTAAAQVEEKAKVTTWVGKSATINYTIERCAQVAEECETKTYPDRVVTIKVAAAIRKLKDEK